MSECTYRRNPILEEFRLGWSHDPCYGAANWLESFNDQAWEVESIRLANEDQLRLALKVLERIARQKVDAL